MKNVTSLKPREENASGREGRGQLCHTIERQHEVEIEEWLLDLAMEAPLAIVSQQSRETRSLFGASGGMTGKSGRRADSSLLKF